MKHRLVRTRESPKNFHDCKELGKNAEARIFSLSQMSKVKRVSTLPWREKMREANIFSEKFLELSGACPCRRAASCQLFFVKSGCGSAMSKFILPLLSPCTDFAQEKSRERAAAPCKEQSKHNQTHTSLSECLINENRSKYFSENIGQAVIGGDDEAGYGSGKRRKVKQKRHCRSARCRQSQHHVHRSQSLRQNHHVPHSKLHTMNASHPHYL